MLARKEKIYESKRPFHFLSFAMFALAAIALGSCTVYNKSTVPELSAGIDQFVGSSVPIHYQSEGKWKTSKARNNDLDAMKETCNFIKSETDFAKFEKFVEEKAASEGIAKWNKAVILFNNLRLNGKKGPVAIYLFYSDNKTYIFGQQPRTAPFERIAKSPTIPTAVLMFSSNLSDGMHVAERDEQGEAYFSIHAGESNRSFGTMNFLDENPKGYVLSPGERAYCNLMGLIRSAIENKE